MHLNINIFIICHLVISFLIKQSIEYYNDKLAFNDSVFRIIHFTDLHYSESVEEDTNTTILQERLLNSSNPNLVIITGDGISGYNNDNHGNFTSRYYQKMIAPYIKFKIPYAYVLGNHDDEGDLSRGDIFDLERIEKYSVHKKFTNLKGKNLDYHFFVYSSINKTQVALIVWCFDTNANKCEDKTDSYGCVEKPQIDWYVKTSEAIKKRLGYMPKGLAFFHIPICQYRDAFNYRVTYAGSRNDQISCPRKETGFFEEVITQNNILGMFCGHDHNNDFCAKFYGVELCYGRKTGYGQYGPDFAQRGGRVVNIKEEMINGSIGVSYNHHILQEDLTIINSDYNTGYKGREAFVRKCKFDS